MFILCRTIYRCNAIPNKISMISFTDWKTKTKVYMETQNIPNYSSTKWASIEATYSQFQIDLKINISYCSIALTKLRHMNWWSKLRLKNKTKQVLSSNICQISKKRRGIWIISSTNRYRHRKMKLDIYTTYKIK
jgi:hypothetical protein